MGVSCPAIFVLRGPTIETMNTKAPNVVRAGREQQQPYLGEGTPAVPSNDGDIQIIVMQKAALKRRKFAEGSEDNIKTPNKQRYAGGLNIEAQEAMRDKIVLRDGKNNPIAVCLKQFLRFTVTYRIYGFRPIVPNQQAAKKTHEGRQLYKWAEVKDEKELKFSLSIWDGTAFHREYQAFQVARPNGPQTMIITHTDAPCALLEALRDRDFFPSPAWKVTIKPGFDPCLVVCFIAVLDDMREIMRKKGHTKGAVVVGGLEAFDIASALS